MLKANTIKTFAFVFTFIIVALYFATRSSFFAIERNAVVNNTSTVVEPMAKSQSRADLSVSKNTMAFDVGSAAIKPVEGFESTDKLTPREASEAKAWLASKGHIGQVNSEYLTYNIETLDKLVNSGDVQAIVPLGLAYLRRSGIDTANQFFLDMAARGYTHVFNTMGSFLETDRNNNSVTTEEKASSAIEILANYNVAELRGDRWPNIASANSFIRSNNIQLSDEDLQKVNARSQEIYNQMQQKRTELGLGDFDNSVPASVKKYFDQFDFLNESTKKN